MYHTLTLRVKIYLAIYPRMCTPPSSNPYAPSSPGLFIVYTPTDKKHYNQQKRSLYFFSPFACASLFLAPPALRLHRWWREDGLRRGVEIHERRPRRGSPGGAVQRHEHAQGAASVLSGGRHRRCRHRGLVRLGRGTAPRCTLRRLSRWRGGRSRRRGFLGSVARGGRRRSFFSSVVVHVAVAAAAAAATAGDAAVPGAVSGGSAALNLFDRFCVCVSFVCTYVVVVYCDVFAIVLCGGREM